MRRYLVLLNNGRCTVWRKSKGKRISCLREFLLACVETARALAAHGAQVVGAARI